MEETPKPEIIGMIEDWASPGVEIPKPETDSVYRVKGWGNRRGERALIYLIPPRTNRRQASEKGVTESEWKQSYDRLVLKGELSHSWFRSALVGCCKEGSCNFTTIGGVFVALGIAARQEKGVYGKARGIMSKNHIRDHWESPHRNLKGGKEFA